MKEEIFKNKLFILESTKTNQPFLTQNGECLLFLDPKEATEMAKQYEVELSECELVEDTLNILFGTVCEGIVSTHVANIFADLTDGE